MTPYRSEVHADTDGRPKVILFRLITIFLALRQTHSIPYPGDIQIQDARHLDLERHANMLTTLLCVGNTDVEGLLLDKIDVGGEVSLKIRLEERGTSGIVLLLAGLDFIEFRESNSTADEDLPLRRTRVNKRVSRPAPGG